MGFLFDRVSNGFWWGGMVAGVGGGRGGAGKEERRPKLDEYLVLASSGFAFGFFRFYFCYSNDFTMISRWNKPTASLQTDYDHIIVLF